ncbi:ferritin-like domain-containing protein [Anaerocolumna sp. MB42-C2]|uniref:ferritin-like domain-containing protein n=1 Tax=Anaerocolumna sp. MB42-C2 TaxID=3070997 RepID=UPI0027DFFACB|nr:ferritin-like domain-containing protein [Anaerocolumna sp. MB42-C2]WMJ85551.1 ferritin-like domain-containing protein [Anaerocolumna sp. MB42-C2]
MNYNNYIFPNDYNSNIYERLKQMEMKSNAKKEENIYVYPDNLDNALSLIQQAVSGENEDRIFYSYLIDNAQDNEDKEIITGIRKNEMDHYKMFRQIYYDITGTMLPKVKEEEFVPPKSYCDGLRKALLGEQNAVRKYRQILYAMQPRIHVNMLTEIITDEIRHGILYNYLYSKNNCM